MARDQRLALMIVPGGHRLEPWIRACALYATDKLLVEGMTDVVVEALDDDELLVRQTDAWALSRITPEGWHESIASRRDTFPDAWLEDASCD